MRFQRLLVLGALATAVYMFAPPTSPFFASARSRPSVVTDVGVPALDLYSTASVKPRPRPAPVKVKGILATGFSAGGTRMNELVSLIGRTELNAVVIDIKDESGHISWMPRSPLARSVEAGLPKITDPRGLIRSLRSKGIYVIGRIVTFKDPVLATVRPDLAVQDIHGGLYHDRKGLEWVDPYSPEVWAYDLDLAREAVRLGFQEIQFDYVRFPGDLDRTWFPHHDLRPEEEVIHDFLAQARRVLVPMGVYLSADVFGLTTAVEDSDLGIGQRIELIAREVDYLSLMLYPSHYNKPEYGLPDPEREPYTIVSLSLSDAKRRIAGTRAKLRPWLQAFTLNVPYTPIEVRAQIKAVEDAGINGWLLWNAPNHYPEDALRPAATPAPARRRSAQ